MEYCLEVGCQVANKKEDKNMVKCILCMKWHHTKCVDIKSEDGAWTCYKCRQMATKVETLTVHMGNLTTLVTKMGNILEKSETEYKEQLSKLQEENSLLKDEVKRLKGSKPKATKNLLLGSSLIRDIPADMLQETDTDSFNNSKIIDAKTKISKMSKTYNKMVLVLGGNDCDQNPHPTAEEVVNKYEALIDTAKDKAEDIMVCGITPRRYVTEDINETTDAVNAGLTELCQRKEVGFTDVSPILKLNDGTINDGYFSDDGIHLNKSGLNKLAKRLKLKCKDEADGYVRKTEVPSRDGKQDGAWTFQGRKNNRSTSQVSSNNRFKGNTNIVWRYKCGAGGHTSNLCRFSTPVECHKCHKFGHKYKFCHLYNKV